MRWSVFVVSLLVVSGGWMMEGVSASEGEILFFAEGEDGRGIYAMDFGGGHVRKVGALSDREAVVTSMSASRDGKKLLCVVAMEARSGARKLVIKAALPRSGMERYGDEREIGGTETLRTAVLSPNGRRIAWVGTASDGGMDLWVKDVGATLEGSEHLVHFERPAQIWSPSFDPQSARIVYAINSVESGRLEVVNPDGEVTPLHRMDGERIVSVDWSFREEIGFMSARGRILTMRPDGGRPKTFGALHKTEIGQPRVVRWSRDATRCVAGCFPHGVATITEGGNIEKWTGDGKFSKVYGTVAVRPVPEKKDLASEVRRRRMPELAVDSVPSGARVSLDGKVRGNTPFRTQLEIGSHRIKVEKAFCADWERTLYLSRGEKKRIVAELEKRGNLRVSSEPSGASLFVDGVFAGLTPLTLESLPSEPRIIEVTCEGWEPMRDMVSVEPGRTTEVVAALRKPLLPLLRAEDVGRTMKPYVTMPDAESGAAKKTLEQRMRWGLFYGGLSTGLMGAKFIYEKADGKGISLCVGGLICALVAYPREKEGERSEMLRAIRAQNSKIRQTNAETELLLKTRNTAIEAENREIEAYNRERVGKRMEVR